MTVEASLVLILILGILGGMMRLSLTEEYDVRAEAEALLTEEDGEERIRPVDLIRLEQFVIAWLPERSQ